MACLAQVQPNTILCCREHVSMEEESRTARVAAGGRTQAHTHSYTLDGLCKYGEWGTLIALPCLLEKIEINPNSHKNIGATGLP